MKRQLFAVIACVATACAAGPRTTPEEFFTKHLDTSIPALSSIPAKVAVGDLAGAEKVFADHVRATTGSSGNTRARRCARSSAAPGRSWTIAFLPAACPTTSPTTRSTGT